MILNHDHFELNGKIILERVIFEPPLKIDAIMHNEACYLHAVKGKSKLYGAKDSVSLASDEGVVMKCGTYLNNWFSNVDKDPYQAVGIHFYPDVLKLVFDDEIPDFLTSVKIEGQGTIQKVQTEEMIIKYIESLLYYFDNPGMVTDDLIKLKVRELILLLINSENSDKIISIFSDLFNPDTYEFKEIVHAHLYDDLQLEDLASLTSMSLSSFKRKFKAVFDSSPNAYIQFKRLEKAKKLLENPAYRITDIAYECGFNDVGYFSKAFGKQFKKSPSDYRKMQLG